QKDYTLAGIHQNQSNNNMTIEHNEKFLLFQKNIYSNSHPFRMRTHSKLAK
ncbi:unnamed protein product, partial [Rotaria sp. Silwood1]